MAEPLVRLLHAELLFVTLSVVTDELQRRTDYPVDNLRLALNAYEKGRDEYLRYAGWNDTTRLEVTAAATQALTEWIDERSLKRADEDFQQWSEELFGENDDHVTD
jgi:hypothetical protein